MFWNTMPILSARMARRSSAPRPPTSVPLIRIWPWVGSISRLMWRTRVDLPEPDRPMMQKTSPSPTLMLTSRTPTTASNCSSTSAFERLDFWIAARASCSRSPKIFQTFLASTTGFAGFVLMILLAPVNGMDRLLPPAG